MLPSPAELRDLSERMRAAVPSARTDEMKRLLANHASLLARVADDLERNAATVDPLLRRANVERYERLLATLTDERTRRVIQELLEEENAALDKERRQIRAWRLRAEELRASADQFEDGLARTSLYRAADNLDRMADHSEALLMGFPRAPGEKAG